MVVRSVGAFVAVVLSCLLVSEHCESSFISYPSGFDSVVEADYLFRSPGHHQAVGVRKYVSSFTSYQFPNPFPPGQDPLSRLEFPIDQWFMGIQLGYVAPSWTLSGQGWINVSRESARKMQDSDWDDETSPGQKTIFSESQCRLNRGLLLELQLSIATPLERLYSIRPVAGCRYDYFFFTTHDGFQASLQGDSANLPGDGIEFKQTFYHYYVGGMINKTLDVRPLTTLMSKLDVEGQFDYAIVNARNEDLHLLRSGERITVERTRGHCWHVRVRAALLTNADALVGIEGDFKRLLTDGSHELTNRILNVDFSFGGSKVWSDQAYISVYGAIKF